MSLEERGINTNSNDFNIIKIPKNVHFAVANKTFATFVITLMRDRCNGSAGLYVDAPNEYRSSIVNGFVVV